MGRVGVDLYALDYNTPLKDVRTFAKYVGGGAANISIGLAKLGLKVAIISKVSDDELGQFVKEYLSRQNVDTTYLTKTSKGKTGIVFAETNPGRDSEFLFYRENAADLQITRRDVENSAVNETKVLISTGTGLSANPSRGSLLAAMEKVSRSGRVNVFNLDWRPTLWNEVSVKSRLGYFRKAVMASDIVIGNEQEFKAATGESRLNGAVASVYRGNKDRLVILTRGEDGSRMYESGKIIDAPAYKVDWLKSLGAGDGMLAGIIYGFLNGWDRYRMLRFGNAIAALVVMRHSCSEAMPSYDETMMFIESKGGF